MGLAFTIAYEDWLPFSEETVIDLMAFLQDAEADRHIADPGPAMNDNFPPRFDRSRISEQPVPVVWDPRWRTAD